MVVNGFLYAARTTNALAEEVTENAWDTQLIPELGTLRNLFIHIVRVRDVYRNGLKTGEVQFPGKLPSGKDIACELDRSMEELADAFSTTYRNQIKMGAEEISPAELLGSAIKHEGIHQGQYYVALKQAGLEVPALWKRDWGM
ncbi:DinB family protein [Evansella sp. LMS18]|jgi:uncharacterized damage-inducible protein DinB|uniref:DinB family protein n=1 Tax=Evansella sp. LMS18 TaxID=2924033 RepID=UPI0020D19AC7|nr:DinB family protein [Evansella sp. LMS18]UTR10021.1 DinB family protein [Evansella sp. LMS18]